MKDSPLLESAREFVVEAIEDYRRRKLAFAILHAVTAIELVLKERLWRVNPALIYRNIDERNAAKGKTVGLDKIPQRLANLGTPLAAGEVTLIETFAKWRHQIVHHTPNYDPSVASSRLPQLLEALAVFLRRDLGSPLESFLPRDLYKVVDGLLDDWKGVVSEAQSTASAEGSVLRENCPDCGASQVLSIRHDDQVYCHLCHLERYRYGPCSECGRNTLWSGSAFGDAFCDACVAAAGEAYIQMHIDMARGK